MKRRRASGAVNRRRAGRQKMNAPATNAATAIIQSRGCKFLMKSIRASMVRSGPYVY